MSRVRPLHAGDLPALAALWIRAFQRPGTPSGVARYFHEVFLAHPLSGDDPASLVHEDDAGAVVGFVGALPRRMVFRGRPIRAVVATQLMVDPERLRRGVALDLLRALFSGPQELTFCDGANERTRRVWERSGGEAARLYSLEWQRVLRPAGYLRQRVARAGAVPAARAAAPFCSAVDAIAGRLEPLHRAVAIGLPFGRPRARLVDEELTCAPVLALMDEAPPNLRPSYDAASLSWLLDQAARTRGHGPLRRRVCRDVRGEPMGWYVHYAKPGSIARVLQFGG